MVSPLPEVGTRVGTTVSTPTTRSPSSAGSALANGPAAVDRADIRPLDLSGALQILIAEVRAALVEVLAADLAGSPPNIANPLNPVAGNDSLAADNPLPSSTSAEGEVASLIDNTAQAAALAGSPRDVSDSDNTFPDNDSPASNTGLAGNAGEFAATAAPDVDGPVPAARAIVELALQSLPETFEPNAWSVALPRMDLALQSGVQRAVEVVSVWRDVPPVIVAATQESGNLALALLADEPIYPWPPAEWLGMAPGLGRLWRRRRFLKRRLADPDYGANRNWDDLNEPGR